MGSGRGCRPRRWSWRPGLDQTLQGESSLCSSAITPTGVTPPLLRLRAQDHRVFFRDHGDHLQFERVLDRQEAYR